MPKNKNRFEEPELEKEPSIPEPVKKVSEKKINEVLNRGLNTSKNLEVANDKAKSFSLDIMESQLKIIGDLCEKRPKRPGRRISLSKQDWILEAVLEKIERETKKYS